MKPTIALFPGLGADLRLFDLVRSTMPGVAVPPWPALEPADSMQAFAKRLVDSMPSGDSMYLGGSSFGGMVALELAALVRPKGVFLIGSCTSPSCIVRPARLIRPLLPGLPMSLFRPRRWMLPLVASRVGRLTAQQRELFWSMATCVPPPFFKWGVQAILSWKPTPVAVPVHHIHGSDDRLIPIDRVRPDRVVLGGGHLLTLTHPKEVASFLSETVCSDALA